MEYSDTIEHLYHHLFAQSSGTITEEVERLTKGARGQRELEQNSVFWTWQDGHTDEAVPR